MTAKDRLNGLCQRRDCFAHNMMVMNCCVALENTEFKGDCPFYKSKTDNDCERFICKQLNEQRGVKMKDGYVDPFDNRD